MNNKYWDPELNPATQSVKRINQYNIYGITYKKILDNIDIKEIEKYLRKKKLENLKTKNE